MTRWPAGCAPQVSVRARVKTVFEICEATDHSYQAWIFGLAGNSTFGCDGEEIALPSARAGFVDRPDRRLIPERSGAVLDRSRREAVNVIGASGGEIP